MFERAKWGENAIIVHIDFFDDEQRADLGEFKELALSAGARIVRTVTTKRAVPDPKYFIGRGKVDEIRDIIRAAVDDQNESQSTENADPKIEEDGSDQLSNGLSSESPNELSAEFPPNLVLFNHPLTPAQERNLEKHFQCRVLDRTGLILDIFAQRAQSFEGKLQVELAQLRHFSTRLIRGWTHLERQKGGIGLRGPGETQLESDRRMIRKRIKYIERRLTKVRKQRDQSRRARQKALLPTVSLVGYTNAGKSTLFNSLTGSDIYVADKLFATLDPTLRQLPLPGAGKVVLADTVGFIRNLPHNLVEAFSATLQETRDASLLLHVIDINDPDRHEHGKQVKRVLEEIGADDIPILEVQNKIDLLYDEDVDEAKDEKNDADADVSIDRNYLGKPTRVRVSAANNIGIEALKKAIAEWIYGDPIQRTLILSPSEGALRAKLYEMNGVLSEKNDDEGNWLITIRIAKNDFVRLFPGEVVEV